MKAFSSDFENLEPVESYAQPKLPMLDEKNPDLLKKLPKRWQNNIKVLTFITLTGTIALAGLAGCEYSTEHPSGIHNGGESYPIYITQPTEEEVEHPNYSMQQIEQEVEYPNYATQRIGQETERAEFVWSNHLYDSEVRLHFGGHGFAFYVAHITEQEALGILRAQLEAAGLDLSAALPDFEYLTDRDWISPQRLNFFDSERNVAIAFVDTFGGSFFRMRDAELLNEFSELKRHMAVGVFRDSGQLDLSTIGIPGRSGVPRFLIDTQRTLSDEENVRVQLAILNRITRQVDAFIYDLQERGILEIPGDQRTKLAVITVTLDGEPIELDVAPIIEEEGIMVPFCGIFEAIGMEVTWNEDSQTITAMSENLVIEVIVDEHFATVNGERVSFHPQVTLLVDGTVMIPLRFVENNGGVFVRWSERTQTVIIESE
jgi:hypothetical protein